MNVSEILKLIDAGYTKAEIDALENPTPVGDAEKINHHEGKEDSAPNPTPTPTPTPVGYAEKNEHPAGVQTDDETRKLVQALGLKFDNLLNAIHTANVNGMEMPTDEMTTESIIAGMIDPQYNNKGGKK